MPDVVLQILLSMGSAAAGVAIAAWKLSRDLEHARGEAAEAKKKVEKLEEDFDRHLAAEQQAWIETAGKLGEIQGAMGLPPGPPRRSRPGPV